MTRKDVENLWNLLDELYPDSPQLRSKERRATWFFVLEPYGYENVKAAAFQRARENKYPPDRVSDIAIYVEKPDAPERESYAGDPFTSNGYQDEADYLAQLRAIEEMGKLMEHDYTAAGIPHPNEAKKRGWTVAEWNERCRAHEHQIYSTRSARDQKKQPATCEGWNENHPPTKQGVCRVPGQGGLLHTQQVGQSGWAL